MAQFSAGRVPEVPTEGAGHTKASIIGGGCTNANTKANGLGSLSLRKQRTEPEGIELKRVMLPRDEEGMAVDSSCLHYGDSGIGLKPPRCSCFGSGEGTLQISNHAVRYDVSSKSSVLKMTVLISPAAAAAAFQPDMLAVQSDSSQTKSGHNPTKNNPPRSGFAATSPSISIAAW